MYTVFLLLLGAIPDKIYLTRVKNRGEGGETFFQASAVPTQILKT